MKRLFSNIVSVVFSLTLVVVVFEVGLRIFLPSQVVTIGRAVSHNGMKYGWGFDSHESIIVSDPDTAELFVGKANSRGWRDVEHSFDNPNGAFRIVVIGDSITFGAIVAQEKIYTRVLEKKFRDNGYNVEVISLAYGGMGTDQELEILKEEGIKYGPDIVLLQFTYNDLLNIMVNRKAGQKPFAYHLDSSGALSKKRNEYFFNAIEERNDTVKYNIKSLANHSDLAKRAYILYRKMVSEREKDDGYFITSHQIKLLNQSFGITTDGSDLGRFLAENEGKAVQYEKLVDLIEASGLQKDKDAILRLCEKRWFHRFRDTDYFPEEPNLADEKWRLLFALFGEILNTAKGAGADLEVISDNEQGFYDWQMFWHRYDPSEKARENYLMPTELVRSWTRDNGVGFVEPIAPFERARNDPHPNNRGYETMAESLYLHISKKYANELNSYRLK